MPDMFWNIVLSLVLFGIYLASLLYILYDRKWKALSSFLFGIVFVWMIFNVGPLNSGKVIEFVFAAASLIYFIAFPTREFESPGKAYRKKLRSARSAETAEHSDCDNLPKN